MCVKHIIRLKIYNIIFKSPLGDLGVFSSGDLGMVLGFYEKKSC